MTSQEKIQARQEEILEWLRAHAPHAGLEQKHLDEGSAERAYWHYGYLMGLRDAAKLLTN